MFRYAVVNLRKKLCVTSPRAAFRTDPRCLVQVRRDGAHLVLREPGDAHLLGHPLHLAGARAGGVHLGDGGDEGAVHALVALEHVLREEAAGARLRIPVAVATVRPAAAQLVGLGVHHGVHDLLGEPAKQLLHISMAPSSKRGMASMSGVGSDKISIAVFVLSRNLLLW